MTENNSEEITYLLDTSAFIIGVARQLRGQLATTSSVLQEVKSLNAKEAVMQLTAIGRLIVKQPSSASLESIDRQMKATGDSFSLSSTDRELLALALDYLHDQIPFFLVSDDYSIQNIAQILHIPYRSYAQKGIKEVWTWEIYCPACFFRIKGTQQSRICPRCGTKLKRRRRK